MVIRQSNHKMGELGLTKNLITNQFLPDSPIPIKKGGKVNEEVEEFLKQFEKLLEKGKEEDRIPILLKVLSFLGKEIEKKEKEKK